MREPGASTILGQNPGSVLRTIIELIPDDLNPLPETRHEDQGSTSGLNLRPDNCEPSAGSSPGCNVYPVSQLTATGPSAIRPYHGE